MKFTHMVNMRPLCTFCHFTAATGSICKKRNVLDLLLCKFRWLRPNCRLLKIIIVQDDAMWSGTNVLTFCCNLQGRKISDVPNSATYRKMEKNRKLLFCHSYLPLVHSQPLHNRLLTPHAAYSSSLNMEIANSSKQFIHFYHHMALHPGKQQSLRWPLLVPHIATLLLLRHYYSQTVWY